MLALFNPGSGVAPPLLAGREQPLAAMDAFLMRMRNKDKINADVVLYGPRGNGKTVLMKHFRDRVAGNDWVGGAPVVLNVKAASIRTLPALVAALRGPNLVKSARVNAGLLSVDIGSMTDAEIEATLGETLSAACQHAPRVMTLDEAHTLDMDVGKFLLNLSQQVREDGAPFLLALAGTPNLKDHLKKMDATFWSRSEILPVGLISREAARDALVVPLFDKGLTVDGDALAAVVDESQCYPWFLQVWGRALCEVAVENSLARLDVDAVEAARPSFDARRDNYYQERYQEMAEAGLLEAAAIVTDLLLDGGETLDTPGLTKGLAKASGTDEAAARGKIEQLAHLGFTWEPDLSAADVRAKKWHACEPGIPSLMTYVREKVAP